MQDHFLRFFLELQFGGLIEASRCGSLSAHEIANRCAQACNVIAKRRELGGDVYLEPLSPIVDFPLGLLLRVTITLLKEAEQFAIFAFDEFNILISQLLGNRKPITPPRDQPGFFRHSANVRSFSAS